MTSLPPDAGHWYYDDVLCQWTESDQTVGPERDQQYRERGEPHLTVDGFPRQGNRYVRSHMLSGLPTCSMPYRLSHSQRLVERAVDEGHFVFITIRNPIESISSYIAMTVNQQHKKDSIFSELQKTLYTDNDKPYVEKCINFYTRFAGLCWSLRDRAHVVPFERVTSMTHESFIKRIQEIVDKDLLVDLTIDTDEGRSVSTANTRLKQYLIGGKFNDALYEAKKAYEKAMDECQSI